MVFVLDKRKKPLMPCESKRARKLLVSGRARVHRLYPFTIRLTDRLIDDSSLQPLRLSLDPGSQTTGLAMSRIEVVRDDAPVMHIRFLMELIHRGRLISEKLTARCGFRRRRRAQLRYRAPRFDNRTKPEGWLAPSLRHRVETTAAWVTRLRRLAPITHLAQELVRFDMHLMRNPEIGGVQYQQGTLAGYEVREYLLEKWGRACAYCDARDVPLEIDHVMPRARGGSNRIDNLALACHPCNRRKDASPVRMFLAHDPERLARILRQVKTPLRDASAVNATRWVLFRRLCGTGLPVETGSGGLTKFNRSKLGIPKTHALDAACVGKVSDVLGTAQPVLSVKCAGRGSHCRTRLDVHGFPRGYLTRDKRVKGFATGDMVTAKVPNGIKAGIHAGRVAVRASGSFNIQTNAGVVQGISHRYCRVTQRADGYGYSCSTGQPERKA
ncbi:MAG: RNA-guided endonuclease IscB [Betaproteobacteria bacterium]|nr:RNA-guided endonuclease IscB [Betaproteobacteria bacterium]